MRAVAYQKSLPIEDEHALVDVDLPTPAPQGRDLLVQVQAVSVNPVDTKVRKRTGAEPEQWKVLGYDAAGLVRASGPKATGRRIERGRRAGYVRRYNIDPHHRGERKTPLRLEWVRPVVRPTRYALRRIVAAADANVVAELEAPEPA